MIKLGKGKVCVVAYNANRTEPRVHQHMTSEDATIFELGKYERCQVVFIHQGGCQFGYTEHGKLFWS